MTFYIEFKNALIGRVDPITIGSFSFLSSLFNVYAGAKLLLKDFAREHNNDIKTGMDVDIHFVEENSTKKGYVVNMSVLSFTKVPGPSTTNYIDITLVSRAYFYNDTFTTAYSGTVSQIADEIYSSKFSKYYNSFDLHESKERPRIRYQLGEKYIDFIDRISKYGYVDNKPMYLYSDTIGNLNLKSISNMESSYAKYMVTPLIFHQENQKVEVGELAIPLIAMEYSFNGANRNSISEYSSIFNTSLFISPSSYSSTIIFRDTEDGNAQTEVLSPSKVEYYGWNLTPDDAMGISIRKNYERTADTYTFSAVFDSFLIEEMKIGSVVYVILPFDPSARSANGTPVNAGEGKYMVSQVKLVYEKNLLRTYANMIQVSY